MLDRVKAKRDAIEEEIVKHQEAIDALNVELNVYDKVIEDEENYILSRGDEPDCDNQVVKDSEGEHIVRGITYAD